MFNFCRVDPFEDKEKCKECRGWFDKKDLQEVKTTSLNYFDYQKSDFYCPTHNKPYDSVVLHSGSPPTYRGTVSVDEDGTPIGYKKK